MDRRSNANGVQSVLYESRTIINGKWPAFACWKGATEGYWSRVPYSYSWYGVLIGSLSFYFLFHLPIYEVSTVRHVQTCSDENEHTSKQQRRFKLLVDVN